MTRRDRDSRSDIIAAALASGATQRAAGRAAGVSERTVRRRLEQPEFAAQVADKRAELVTRMSDRLSGLASKALDTMESLLSADVAPGVRGRTASGLLAACRVWRDAAEIEDRLRIVEGLLAAHVEQGESR